MGPGERTGPVAFGPGKLPAGHIDAGLRGAVYHKPPKHPPVTFDMPDLPVFLDAARRREPELPLAVRGSFDEVVHGLTEQQARFDARPCSSCGTSFECDTSLPPLPEPQSLPSAPGPGYRVAHTLGPPP